MSVDPVGGAALMGHTVVNDPPAIMTAAERWTCTKCGRAVLRFHRQVYGSALTTRCDMPGARPL